MPLSSSCLPEDRGEQERKSEADRELDPRAWDMQKWILANDRSQQIEGNVQAENNQQENCSHIYSKQIFATTTHSHSSYNKTEKRI